MPAQGRAAGGRAIRLLDEEQEAEGFRAIFRRPLRRSRDQRDSPRLEQSGGHHVVAGQRSAHEFDARRLFIQRDCERLHDGEQRRESPRQHPPNDDGQQRPRRQSICADGYRRCRWHQLQRQQPDLPDRPPDLRQRNDLGAFQPRCIRVGQREHGVSFLRQQGGFVGQHGGRNGERLLKQRAFLRAFRLDGL